MSLPVPAQRFRLLLPPTQPAVPHVTLRMGSNRRKARPRGEDLSTQIQSPPCSSVGRGGGGNKLRGAEKGAPASKLLQQRDKQEVRLRGSAAGATPQAAALALGVRLASAGRREKTKQNRKKNPNNQKKKEPTETSRTPEECNATTPSWRALQGGGWRSWVSNAVNSFRVIPPSTLPCNSDPSVEV